MTAGNKRLFLLCRQLAVCEIQARNVLWKPVFHRATAQTAVLYGFVNFKHVNASPTGGRGVCLTGI